MTNTHESWEKKAFKLLQKEKAREKTMPSHEGIAKEIRHIIECNVDFHAAHNRENLDDIIADLIQYRDTLPTVQEYIEAGEL